MGGPAKRTRVRISVHPAHARGGQRAGDFGGYQGNAALPRHLCRGHVRKELLLAILCLRFVFYVARFNGLCPGKRLL